MQAAVKLSAMRIDSTTREILGPALPVLHHWQNLSCILEVPV